MSKTVKLKKYERVHWGIFTADGEYVIDCGTRSVARAVKGATDRVAKVRVVVTPIEGRGN